MTNRRELHCYDYVNKSFAAVRDALSVDPVKVFHDATSRGAKAAAGSELRLRIGAVEIAAEIEIEIVTMQEARSPLGKPAFAISFVWSSPRKPGWFPTMTGTLTMYSLTPTETQLDFDGVYQPPLGVFGAAVDAVALHGFAEASVQGFIRELAVYLRAELGDGDPKPAVA